MLKAKIENRLNEFIAGSDLFFVDVKVTPQQKIMLFVDGHKNISIDKCVEISRMMEAYLEDERLVGDKYIFEVSSPGMDQPFKVKEQYLKSIGRTIEVLKKDGVKYEGVLNEIMEDAIILEVPKMKKGKVMSTEIYTIPLSAIKTTKKLITFK